MSSNLARQELEVMKLIWRSPSGTATVRDLYEAIRERRQIAYTSVVTTLRSLERKGFLRKWQEGKAHVYQPTRPREAVIEGLLQDFVARVFNGSDEAMVLHMYRQKRLSKTKLREIEKLIEESD